MTAIDPKRSSESWDVRDIPGKGVTGVANSIDFGRNGFKTVMVVPAGDAAV
jgi:hypothetical protein